jgi:exodeoxyribonuclease V beta subunit
MAALRYRRPAIIDLIPLDRHCVIEANAGTGKTFTIEHLIIELLLNSDIRLDQLLAVTFTEKAAADLRARIRAAIERTFKGAASDEDVAGTTVNLDDERLRRLERALFSFDTAPIHTIHSFCRRTLADLAFQTGTRLAVEVAEAGTLFHEAFRAELRERLASDEPMRSLLEEWLSQDTGGTIDKLESLLLVAHRNRYVWSGASKRNAEAIESLLKFDLKTIKRAFSKPATLKALDLVGQAIDRFAGDPWKLRRAIDSAGLDSLRHPGAKPSPLIADFLNIVERLSFACTLEACIADTFLPAIAQRLEANKRERGVIDFDDMPGWLWAALEGPQGEGLAAAMRDRLRVALIDEFQDTDDLQWKIFRRIFVEAGGNHRLYVIGDPKQSIYAFRGADVFTYLEARRELTTHYGAELVPLAENFRSTRPMIDAVNLIFDPAAPEALFASGEIRYEHPSLCGRPLMKAFEREREAKPVTIFELQADKLSARRCRELIGRALAGALKALIDGSNPIEIADEKNRKRIVTAGGIFVLTRSGIESREMAGYLRDAGVPYAFYKQDGLFQTSEAGHVLDVLRAVAQPYRRSNRLKAWSTPFFGIKMRDLPGLEDVQPSHPLMARLLEWKALADQERFAEMFAAMLNGSGLAARELLLADSPRELTNYEHIFEILLEQAFTKPRNLDDLVHLLARWVAGIDLPPGEEPGVQRLDRDSNAVQIMTVHKAKGLEADVVALFGGYAIGGQQERISVFHRDGIREVIAGRNARNAAGAAIKEERHAEDERLLYVALTRARARLYLATFPPNSTKRELSGYYGHLNRRLLALASDPAHASEFARLIERIPLGPHPSSAAAPASASTLIGGWTPPAVLLDENGDRDLARLRDEIIRNHPPLAIESYTSMQRRIDLRDGNDRSIFKFDQEGDGVSARDDLAGGRAVGIFLHEVIERLDLGSIAAAQDAATWKSDPEVRRLIEAAARRHLVPHRDAWIERAGEIVFNALRSPIALDCGIVPALAECPATRELEFTFPIPSRLHPLLGGSGGGGWKIEQGLLTGFVDFVFRFRDRIYFADWKSDRLDSYDPDAIGEHVSSRYAIQAQIYTVGIVRLLRIRDRAEYDGRFGGLLYVFIRGIDPRGDGRAGVYFHRPSWEEVIDYERGLMNSTEGRGWA